MRKISLSRWIGLAATTMLWPLVGHSETIEISGPGDSFAPFAPVFWHSPASLEGSAARGDICPAACWPRRAVRFV